MPGSGSPVTLSVTMPLIGPVVIDWATAGVTSARVIDTTSEIRILHYVVDATRSRHGSAIKPGHTVRATRAVLSQVKVVAHESRSSRAADRGYHRVPQVP